MNLIEQAIEALERWAALIKHQYSGSSEAMSDLQEADNFGQQALAALKDLQQAAQDVELPPITSDSHWSERIKTLMQQAGQPDSQSVYGAMWQLANELQHDAIAYARAAIEAHQARQGWDDFDDGKTADALRSLGIKHPTLLQVTELQKAMWSALAAAPTPESISGEALGRMMKEASDELLAEATQPTEAEAPSERTHIDKLIEYARKLLARRPRHPAEDANDRWEIAAAGLLGQFVAALAPEATPHDDCPKCKGSEVRGFKRGLRCATCDGTGHAPEATQPERTAMCPETETPCTTCPTRGVPCEATQPTQAEAPIPEPLLRAIREAGLTLLKTQSGYQLRKGGPAVAQAAIQPTQAEAPHALVRTIMAKLANLLDEDQFKDIEDLVTRAGVEPTQAEAPSVIECDCETAISANGARFTRCGSDQMRRAVSEGHAFVKLATHPAPEQVPQVPVAWIYWHPSNDTFDGPDTIRRRAVSRFSDDTRIAMQRDGWKFEPLYAAPVQPEKDERTPVAANLSAVANPYRHSRSARTVWENGFRAAERHHRIGSSTEGGV